jgi:hypothetical protein
MQTPINESQHTANVGFKKSTWLLKSQENSHICININHKNNTYPTLLLSLMYTFMLSINSIKLKEETPLPYLLYSPKQLCS